MAHQHRPDDSLGGQSLVDGESQDTARHQVFGPYGSSIEDSGPDHSLVEPAYYDYCSPDVWQKTAYGVGCGCHPWNQDLEMRLKGPSAVDDETQVIHLASHRDSFPVDVHGQSRRRGSSTAVAEPHGLGLGRRHAQTVPLDGTLRACHGCFDDVQSLVPAASPGQDQGVVGVTYHARPRGHRASKGRIVDGDPQNGSQY